jgi:valyl-tRNA synthetase
VFVRLFEQGLIYRGKRLVNWDPVLQTAVSDLEVESQEKERLALAPALSARGRQRPPRGRHDAPETMLGDTGVAVHPEDERYAHLIGKSVRLPLADR